MFLLEYPTVFSLVSLVLNSVFSTLQVLEEEVKMECASCKNYEAQLCKMQNTSKVKWFLNVKNVKICKNAAKSRL